MSKKETTEPYTNIAPSTMTNPISAIARTATLVHTANTNRSHGDGRQDNQGKEERSKGWISVGILTKSRDKSLAISSDPMTKIFNLMEARCWSPASVQSLGDEWIGVFP